MLSWTANNWHIVLLVYSILNILVTMNGNYVHYVEKALNPEDDIYEGEDDGKTILVDLSGFLLFLILGLPIMIILYLKTTVDMKRECNDNFYSAAKFLFQEHFKHGIGFRLG